MFSDQTFEFLRLLNANNNREWFNEHKPDYEAKVREPALEFITQMQPLLNDISSRFLATPKKVGGSLMRVYRDARFSKDKTPYKTNIGIQFRHFMGKDVHAPGFYLHISETECFVGAGIWRPDGPALAKIRSFIDENPRAWLKAKEASEFASRFTLGGESLKRPPRGFTADHPQLEDLKRKDFIAIANLEPDAIKRDDVAQLCSEYFQSADAYMYYLCSALELPYR
ncbi:MAG: hypothetical protein ACI8WB_000989 [Phenylobacterium sp.]|jgi:uncharacterized protein (TIGR02453 family)